MKTKIKRSVFIGAFIGLVLFVIVGFLPSSYTGGILGLKFVELLFGKDILSEPTLSSRLIVVLWMLLTVIITGANFVIGCAVIGWIVGFLLERKKIKERA